MSQFSSQLLTQLVQKYFGESIAPDKLKETLEYVFAIDEVKNFIKSENEKTKPVSAGNNTVENIEMEAC